MKKIFIHIMLLITCVMVMSSCGELLEFTQNFSSEAIKCIDNYDQRTFEYWKQNNPDKADTLFNGYQLRDDKALSGIITALEASNSGTGGLSMVGIKVAGNIIGSFGGLDMTTFNKVMDNSMNSMLADKHSNSNDEMNIVGSFLHMAEEGIYLFEDRWIRMKSAKNAKEFEELQEQANDPSSPHYDPFFDCYYTFETDTNRIGKYGSILESVRSRKRSEVLDCIRQKNVEMAEQHFEKYMQEEYGLNMSYEEYCSLPDSEKPSIESYIFPNQQSAEEILSMNNIFIDDDILDISEDPMHISSTGTLNPFQQAITDLRMLENTKINAYKLNSYKLSEENMAELDIAVDILQRHPEIKIELLGHSCNIGDSQTNYSIGLLRAKVAKKYIVSKGVDAKRISVHSMANKRPIVPNNSPSHRALNRRVEIIILN